MCRLALINYMHSDPLYEALTWNKCRSDPSEILTGVISGRYEAGMISLIEYFRNLKDIQLIESANIHSSGSTLSTLIVSKKSSLSECRTVGVTRHTETTVWYASRVCRDLGYSLEIIKTNLSEADEILSEFDAALVIGDDALKIFRTNLRILMDVGYEYTALYRRPPVFAVTVSKNGLRDEDLKAALDRAVAISPNHVDRFAKENSERLGIPLQIMRAYYSSIMYDYNGAVKRSIEAEHGIFISAPAESR
ncbi:MAG: hypothetical protein M1454_02015 [Candidatus Thermoplasmatota archaeon]|nr:hypothetical protein [Candidatus Thermoplasmatota archaeon]